jgi:hypothetical protein
VKLTNLLFTGASFPYNITTFFKYIPTFLKQCWQRITVGLSDYDVWGLDDHLSYIIPNGVRRLRETSHTYAPGTSPEEWKEILTQIIEGFESAQIIGSNMIQVGEKKQWFDITPEQYKWHQKNFDRGMKLFHKYYFNLWD